MCSDSDWWDRGSGSESAKVSARRYEYQYHLDRQNRENLEALRQENKIKRYQKEISDLKRQIKNLTKEQTNMSYVRVEVNGRVWLIPPQAIGELENWLANHAVDATDQDRKIREVAENTKDSRKLICEDN